ncbi:MAG: linear amide C-N hydrolase [Paramuribaculum sp.]|nr:linear amide C-N hydrolase [Paramuribaculum sp.]
MKFSTLISAILLSAAAFMDMGNSARACTRVVYAGDSTLRIVGRSLDWKTPIPTNLYVYPRGMQKQSFDQPNAIKWTSKYGSVYAVSYDGGITEGMNEKGLSMNGLFCKDSQYTNETNENNAPMSLAMFIGWVLDLSATTQEAVDLLNSTPFALGGSKFDGGTAALLHFGITDPTGDCAIVEFNKGDMKIYRGQDIPTMTNNPQWPEMQAIRWYWEQVGGTHMLPGTVSSPDRMTRGTFFTTHVAKTDDADLGMSITRSIMANVSVPYTYVIEGEPNVSSTQWRSYSNLRDKRYYFEMVTAHGLYYIDLTKCDLRPGAPVKKLETAKNLDTVGEANSHLRTSAPLTPMYKS